MKQQNTGSTLGSKGGGSNAKHRDTLPQAHTALAPLLNPALTISFSRYTDNMLAENFTAFDKFFVH